MEWVEITAKTVDAAKAIALDELGIDSSDAEFEVLEEPRVGLFRQVRGTARVRARVAPRAPRAKVERRSRRTKNESKSQKTEPAKAEAAPKSTKRSKAQDGSKTPKNSVEPGSPAKQTASPETTDGERDDKPTAARNRPKKASRSHALSTAAQTKEDDSTMAMTLEEQITAAEGFLEGLLDAIGYAAAITTERIDERNANVNITGDELGLLIGPRGNTMNAIQDLTRIALQKQAAGSWEGHVHVDVNGYRAKRRAALVEFVESVAEQVRTSGSAKALEPMSSSDRKAVHDTVNGIDGVHTTSEGHEPKRWVKIVPGDA